MILAVCLVLVAGGVAAFMQHPQFGKMPSGKRLDRIRASPNFRGGQFQNGSHTPDLAAGIGYWRVITDFLFDKSARSKPPRSLPSRKTNLLTLAPDSDVVVWFGHSSYFLQVDGKKILVDPVLSGSASPVAFTTRSFAGTDVYTPDEIPELDYLFISHDHWDHLDYETIRLLKPKLKRVITGLGTGAHLEHWGIDPATIIEKDWHETVTLEPGFRVTITPARHFSGRGLTRNKALWVSFVLTTPHTNLFIGGDSGYDTHFAAIGNAHGPFDLAILECGQYNAYWPYIHMMPEEVVRAAQDLNAKRLMPVHWAKFELALHAWDEPIIRVAREAERKHLPLLSPLIGEAVPLKDTVSSSHWWEDVR
ncbi:MAG: MBL fold metallo-hydrolase [Bacteroidetes bacterium]|nr:MBL fold metallo-hydrolase [Fibrella sp.]